MIWDAHPGSRSRIFFSSPDPGVKKAPDPGSRIRIRTTVREMTCLVNTEAPLFAMKALGVRIQKSLKIQYLNVRLFEAVANTLG
jgi:hypothetical protein